METHTINFKDVELEVEGNYIPSEPEQMYDANMTGTPGEPHKFEIEKVNTKDSEVNIVSFIEAFGGLEELEEQILEENY